MHIMSLSKSFEYNTSTHAANSVHKYNTFGTTTNWI